MARLEQAVEERDVLVMRAKYWPDYDPFRDHLRFDRLLKAMLWRID